MEQREDFDLKYIFSDNIERVWSFLRDPRSMFEASKEYLVSFNVIEPQVNLWTVDCKFPFVASTWIGIEMECIKSTSEPYYKSLCYEVISVDFFIKFYIQYSLFQVF